MVLSLSNWPLYEEQDFDQSAHFNVSVIPVLLGSYVARQNQNKTSITKKKTKQKTNKQPGVDVVGSLLGC